MALLSLQPSDSGFSDEKLKGESKTAPQLAPGSGGKALVRGGILPYPASKRQALPCPWTLSLLKADPFPVTLGRFRAGWEEERLAPCSFSQGSAAQAPA